ncbi:BadF/BadG/BcrA/BcrD ATPase [Streptomyces sp. SPB074]|nr:BadF/BadG/BcrA/BcrD ATPase [Streptomyces sp. SPB074]
MVDGAAGGSPGPDGGSLARLAVGAHACETPAMCAELSGHLGALFGIPVTVVNDAELLVPAAGFTTGIGLVAGTGSIAVGRHAETGAYVKAGGWGWVLGDEGSGSALVRERGGADLAALVARLARRGAHHARVVAAGGVITAQPALWSAFTTALAASLPGTRAVLLDAPPVEGAVRLATG